MGGERGRGRTVSQASAKPSGDHPRDPLALGKFSSVALHDDPGEIESDGASLLLVLEALDIRGTDGDSLSPREQRER